MNAILPSGSCMMLLRLMSLASPVILLGQNSIPSTVGWGKTAIDTRVKSIDARICLKCIGMWGGVCNSYANLRTLSDRSCIGSNKDGTHNLHVYIYIVQIDPLFCVI